MLRSHIFDLIVFLFFCSHFGTMPRAIDVEEFQRRDVHLPSAAPTEFTWLSSIRAFFLFFVDVGAFSRGRYFLNVGAFSHPHKYKLIMSILRFIPRWADLGVEHPMFAWRTSLMLCREDVETYDTMITYLECWYRSPFCTGLARGHLSP